LGLICPVFWLVWLRFLAVFLILLTALCFIVFFVLFFINFYPDLYDLFLPINFWFWLVLVFLNPWDESWGYLFEISQIFFLVQSLIITNFPLHIAFAISQMSWLLQWLTDLEYPLFISSFETLITLLWISYLMRNERNESSCP
jgi:hypothetical protein